MKINQNKENMNVIEIGNLRLVSSDMEMKELLKIIDKIITKHKELIKKKEEFDILPQIYS